MALTPEEEKRLREEIRHSLEERLERLKRQKTSFEEGRQKSLEERLRQQIREEEEERFFTDRGFVRYTNHRGETEWLAPEDAEKRGGRRRTRKTSSRRRRRNRRKILQWAVNIGIVVVGFGAFMLVMKYRPVQKARLGSMVISTDVPGAQIYINGTERPGLFTPDTVSNLAKGNYFISVYKEGFSSWPPMQRVTVEADEQVAAEFTLKTAGRFGQVSVESNLRDFRLYVDGVSLQGDPQKPLQIPAGFHVFTGVREGYLANPLNQRVLVPENKVTRLRINFEKQEEVGHLRVSSNRPSAFVYLDNQFTGLAANGKSFPVAPGLYEVRICENGYGSFPESKLLRVEPGEHYTVSLHMKEEDHVDTLAVITPQPGASIIVDGRWTPFVTPMTELVLSEGLHFLNLQRDGRLLAEKDVPVEVNKLENKQLTLNF